MTLRVDGLSKSLAVPVLESLQRRLLRRWLGKCSSPTNSMDGLRNVERQLLTESTNSIHMNRNKVAIVCSARSTDVKETGTTNRLMRAATEAMKPDSSEYIGIIDAMRDDHIQASKDVIRDQALLTELVKNIESECTKVSRLLSAAQILDEISPRTLDNIIGTGEKLSCLFMTALLQDRVSTRIVGLRHDG